MGFIHPVLLIRFIFLQIVFFGEKSQPPKVAESQKTKNGCTYVACVFRVIPRVRVALFRPNVF